MQGQEQKQHINTEGIFFPRWFLITVSGMFSILLILFFPWAVYVTNSLSEIKTSQAVATSQQSTYQKEIQDFKLHLAALEQKHLQLQIEVIKISKEINNK